MLSVGERLARHFAAKENLALDLRLEGNLFTTLVVRDLHATPTGPTAIQQIELRYARVTYSLWGLLRGGRDFLQDLQVDSAAVIIDSSKEKKIVKAAKDNFTLPAAFPQSVRLNDVNVTVRDTPNDTVIDHLSAVLDPTRPGELKAARVHISGGPDFQNVSAGTTYAKRSLVLTNLVLGSDTIALVNVDGSAVNQNLIRFKVDSPFGEGKLSATGALRAKSGSPLLEVHALASSVSAASLNKYIPGAKLTGTIKTVAIDASGIPDRPSSWEGKAVVEFDQVKNGAAGIDSCVLRVNAANRTATIESGEIVRGQNRLELQGSAALPDEMRQFGRVPADISLRGNAADLQAATTGLPTRLSGAAQVEGKVNVVNGRLTAALTVNGGPIQFENGSVEKISAAVNASRGISTIADNEPWFQELESQAVLDVEKVQFGDLRIDTVHGVVASHGAKARLEDLRAARGTNEFTANGDYELPNDFANADRQPAALNFAINAPQLAEFWTPDSPDRVTGPLQGDGEIRWREGVANGGFQLYGSELKTRDLVVHAVSTHGAISQNTVYLNDFSVVLNKTDYVNAVGQIDLKSPMAYQGKVTAQIADLSSLKPLLRSMKNDNELAGSFNLDWQGSGELKTRKNTGNLRLNLEKGRYGDVQGVQSKIESTYSPKGLDVPIIFFASNKMQFQATARAHDKTFQIDKIQLDQGQAKYASGYFSIPFVWANLGTSSELFPPGEEATITFQSENLELKRLFQDLGIKSGVTGTVNLKVDARGTLEKLEGLLEFHAKDLRLEELKRLQPAAIDFSARATGGQLNLTGKLQQGNIQPMQMTAQLPFDAARVLREGGLRDDTPVTAKVTLPRSSVNFIRQFAPEVEQLDGDVAADVEVHGTIGKPIFSGAATMTVNVARSSNSTLPALRAFKARLNFQDDSLSVQEFNGELSGGKFTLTGGVKFQGLTKADVNLQFKADSILVARNDAVTARMNSDIRIAGPLSAASVTGTVEFTNSEFLKNLDLIPIGLPGRPAPQPPSSRPEFSIPDPPLRDWKFDITIKTKEPFRIRGNLANGGAVVDLKLIGTGLHPGLQGQVRLQNLEATLPFSRLEIAYGFLYFDPSDSLNPKMDLHGTSVIRDYTVHVYIYGDSLAPQAIFNSEPPLPQEEIISLLATGTTREELAGNNNVLASRAAMLLVQQLYRKIFKTGQGAQSSSVFDRLDVDIGQTDPRTGQQQASARFKINNQVVLVGDVEVTGSFRGMVKYVIRFR